MEKYLKFIFQKTQGKLQSRILSILKDIFENNLDDLDIKKMSGKKNEYRCRVGDLRIIFKKEGNENMILKINKRGDVY